MLIFGGAPAFDLAGTLLDLAVERFETIGGTKTVF